MTYAVTMPPTRRGYRLRIVPNLGQREPIGPQEIAPDEARRAERARRRDPLRNEIPQARVEITIDLAVDDPPRDVGVGADPFGRIDVHAAEQLRLGPVEHCVVE